MVTAPGSGAEIIPFLKTWVNLPAAIGFTILYAKVSCSHTSQQQAVLHQGCRRDGTLLIGPASSRKRTRAAHPYFAIDNCTRAHAMYPCAAGERAVDGGPVLRLHLPIHRLLRLVRFRALPAA